jgi:hypothetical protein
MLFKTTPHLGAKEQYIRTRYHADLPIGHADLPWAWLKFEVLHVCTISTCIIRIKIENE